MRPTQHSTNSRVLGAPVGWEQGELPCGALAITDADMNGVPCVVSYWQPDAADLAALNAGGLVALSICGRTMPPACLYIETKP